MSYREITPAGDADFSAVIDLLKTCGLPFADLTPAHLTEFRVCRDGARLIALGGLEFCGAAALLRSFAVLPAYREQGLAQRLLAALESHAVATGHQDLYLLTNTAPDYFARRGFRPLAREEAPAAVAASPEFRSLCPASAVFMHKALSDRVMP
jgi:amino-acid N-acetyltransferase